MKNSNLKPLKSGSPTGFWKFSGDHLLPEDIINLRSKGVRIPDYPFAPGDDRYNRDDWDTMPDNRLKLPKHRKNWRATTVRQAVLEDGEFEERYAAWREEWLATPEPRQNFLEWFAQQKSEVLAKEALRAMFDSGRKGDAQKAINTILEHGKSKPKTQIEVSNPNDVEFDLGKAMEVALQEKFGIAPEKFHRFLKEAIQ